MFLLLFVCLFCFLFVCLFFNLLGVPSKVVDSFGHVFTSMVSWQELVMVDKFLDSVYFYDKEQQVLWIRVWGVSNEFTISMVKNNVQPL